MSWVGVCPSQIQNGIREFPPLFFVEAPNPQKDLRVDVLGEPGIPRSWHGSKFPRDPARRVRHASVFFGEAGTGQPVYRSLDILLLFGSDSRSAPELAGFVRINLTDNQPIGLFQCIAVLE